MSGMSRVNGVCSEANQVDSPVIECVGYTPSKDAHTGLKCSCGNCNAGGYVGVYSRFLLQGEQKCQQIDCYCPASISDYPGCCSSHKDNL